MNPFLAPDFEKHLDDLTRGPMTSNAEGVLIRPVDQLAEAVRSLHGERKTHAVEVARLRSVMAKARRLIAETFPPYSFPTPPEHEEEARAAHGVLVQIEAALAAQPSAAVEAVEGMRRALEEIRDQFPTCTPVDGSQIGGTGLVPQTPYEQEKGTYPHP